MRKVVITGASKGIGQAIAKKLVASGDEVINIDLENSKEFKTFVADISDSRALMAIAKEIGKIDVLICNAGSQKVASLEKTSPDDFESVVKTNLCGTYNTIYAFLNYIVYGGRVLIMSSVHGEEPRLEKFAYDASKAGMNMLTKEVALALAPRNIKVNALAIGATNTPMNKETVESKDLLAKTINNIPFGRMLEANEVADVAISMLSKAYDYMTGSIVKLDGGRSLK